MRKKRGGRRRDVRIDRFEVGVGRKEKTADTRQRQEGKKKVKTKRIKKS